MDLSSIFSHDQMAILGCFAAMGVCGVIATLSFKLGPAGQQIRTQRPTIPMNSVRSADTSATQERRAA